MEAMRLVWEKDISEWGDEKYIYKVYGDEKEGRIRIHNKDAPIKHRRILDWRFPLDTYEKHFKTRDLNDVFAILGMLQNFWELFKDVKPEIRRGYAKFN